MKKKSKQERLAAFSDLYEQAKNAAGPTHDRLRRYMAQYQGDPAIDGSARPATAVRNITYEIIEGQISAVIPAPHVSPRTYSERGERLALAIERLCARARDELPFERLNDLDERYTTVYGGSVFLVEWDSSRGALGERGGIRVCCLSPEDFVPQPGIAEVEEMEYCFLRFSVPRRELCRRYGVSEATAARGEAEAGAGAAEEDTVTVVTCFYREEDGRISRFVFSGDAVLSDLSDYYGRKASVCPRCGAPEGCECGEPPILRPEEEEWRVGADGTAYPLPYYRPRHFPVVIRKNISRMGDWIGQSDCEVIRPQQQQINKLESRIQSKLMRAGITPVIPQDARVSPDNGIFEQVLRLQPGESAALYGTLDTTPTITQDILQSDRLYEQAKRLIGVSDTYLGLSDSTATSGYAKRLQVEQAAGRLESKRRMKEAAYADIDRLIFEFTLAYADEPRVLGYRDALGRMHGDRFCRRDFLVEDGEGGLCYDDGFLFSADRNGWIEGQRETLWEKNLENLRAGTLGEPGELATLLRYWQAQERAHYPNARENVEYFKERLAAATPAAEGETEDTYGF